MQLPSPFLILGDFNAHSPVWGSPNTNTRGQIIEDFITSNGENTYGGENTYFMVKTLIFMNLLGFFM